VRWPVRLDDRVQPIRRFSDEQYRAALESWAWLDLAGKAPRFASPFGDIFFEATDGWWFLDTMEGTLQRRWATGQEVQAALNTQEGQDQFLLLGLAQGAEALGVVPRGDEVYDLTPAPILGGAFDPAHVGVTDFVVAVSIAGQLHDRVRKLPPGTLISGITIE
jgi:hypothetical protein